MILLRVLVLNILLSTYVRDVPPSLQGLPHGGMEALLKMRGGNRHRSYDSAPTASVRPTVRSHHIPAMHVHRAIHPGAESDCECNQELMQTYTLCSKDHAALHPSVKCSAPQMHIQCLEKRARALLLVHMR